MGFSQLIDHLAQRRCNDELLETLKSSNEDPWALISEDGDENNPTKKNDA